MDSCYTNTENGIRLKVKVIPRSSKSEIGKVKNGHLKIKLTAPPVDGKANQECIQLLTKFFSVSKGNVTIIAGKTSPVKIVEINGQKDTIISNITKLLN